MEDSGGKGFGKDTQEVVGGKEAEREKRRRRVNEDYTTMPTS